MTTTAEPIVINLELNFDAHTRASLMGSHRELQRHIEDLVARLTSLLGVSGVPLVELQQRHARGRAIRIRVDGKRLPFPAEFLRRAWSVCAPPDYRDLAQAPQSTAGFPDDWLFTAMPQLAANADELPWLREFISHLAVGVLHNQPASLIDAATPPPLAGPDPSAGSLREALQRIWKILADLGLSVGNRALMSERVGTLLESGQSVESTAEQLFAELRPRRVEVHAHPDYLRQLTDADVADTQLLVATDLNYYLEQLCVTLLKEQGLRLPEIVVVASSVIAPQLLAVRVNDALGPALRGLDPGKKLVHAPPAQLASAGVQISPVRHPMTRDLYSMVSESMTPVTPNAESSAVEFAVQCVEAELWRLRSRLLSSEDVEYELALLYSKDPELVLHILDTYPPEVLVRILRALLQEGVVLRDLRTILELLVLYKDPASAGLENCISFLRGQLSSYGVFALRGKPNAPVHEFRLEVPAHPESMTETQVEAFRDRVWTQLADHPDTVMVAPSDKRALVRRLLRDELPDVLVLSESELQAYTPVARDLVPA